MLVEVDSSVEQQEAFERWSMIAEIYRQTDRTRALLVQLVNKLGKESDTAIVFVSHREEPGLYP